MKLLRTVAGLTVGALAGSKNPVYMYVDDWTTSGAGLVAEFEKMADAGVSVILMAFHLVGNPGFPSELADTVAAWATLSESDRKAAVERLHQKGAKLLISSGGESEGRNWLQIPGGQYGRDTCTKLKALNVDGIDFDKEGFAYTTPEIGDWLAKAVQACREVWPEALITSAPQPPNLSAQGGPGFADGLLSPESAMDHYLVQFYNNWPGYTTYEQSFSGGDNTAPSIGFLMKKYPNAPKDTFVFGKPRQPGDGSYDVPLSTIREWICKAQTELGYTGGAMFWKHHVGGDLSEISMIAAPCDGQVDPTSPPTTTTTTSTTTSTTTPAPTTTAAAPTTTTTTTTTTMTTPSVTTRVTTSSIPVTTPAPTQPTTTPQSTTTPGVVTTPGGDVVADCRNRVVGGPGFAHYEQTCKDACADYSPMGQLHPWCPTGNTGATIAACVVKERPYCALA